MNIQLRPFSAEYQDFLFHLYASTRQEQIGSLGWSAAQQEAFLRMQFNAQQRWYETAYAEAEHQLVFLESGDQPIGRMLVTRDAKKSHLVDIALLSEHRGKGIGTQLLRDLIAHSQQMGVPLTLQVLKTNPAARLYERLGFTRTGEDQMYYQMVCE
jgi:ribosomal protein S18 acetylase RimI-like enzyme